MISCIPLSEGSISNSLFLVMLNRELECRLSFLIIGPWTVPVVSLVLLSGVGGGAFDTELFFGCKNPNRSIASDKLAVDRITKSTTPRFLRRKIPPSAIETLIMQRDPPSAASMPN